MEVTIVSKTRMANGVCVGGVLESGQFVRLLKFNGYNQDSDTCYNIGQVYEIEYKSRSGIKPPHVEDILVTNSSFKSCILNKDLATYLKDLLKVNIWEGSISNIFQGKIQWTNGGSGYISENSDIPDNSVGFWISDQDLKLKYYENKARYNYPPQRKKITINGNLMKNGPLQYRNIPFVGFQDPIECIEVGTLIRLSLARWWSPGDTEERCYLQLSGWYDNADFQEFNSFEIEDDNLPF